MGERRQGIEDQKRIGKDMEDKKKKDSGISGIYADVLGKGRLIGIIFLFFTYIIYLFSIVKPYIPVDQLQKLWSLNINEFLEQTKISTGWNWISMLGYSDYMNFVGITILAGITIVSYLSIIPKLFKNKDFIYLGIAVMEVIVLVSAASGFLTASH